jgi:hypothetical protein
MKIYKIDPLDVVDVTSWCLEVFGPAYAMPRWWRIERVSEKYEIPIRYEINILNDEHAALYVLRWE